jgi:hypothetical protein
VTVRTLPELHKVTTSRCLNNDIPEALRLLAKNSHKAGNATGIRHLYSMHLRAAVKEVFCVFVGLEEPETLPSLSPKSSNVL